MKPLLVVDTPLLLYRGFFSVPKSVTNNALLGTATTLLSVIESVQPRAVVLCLGAESATYRTRAYPPYHAHREPMPESLAAQWDLVPSLFRPFGFYVEDAGELEADDLLASYAKVESDAGGRTLILTGDRDLYQCVDAKTHVLMIEKGGPTNVDAAEVEKRYGVRPDQVPDFIALRGDPSDGLPGAKGIGEKSARDLLVQHGTLENVLSNATTGSAAVRALPSQAELLATFKDVATVRRFAIARPADRAFDRAGAAASCREHQLNRFAERLEK